MSQIALLPFGVTAAMGCLFIHCRKKPAAGKDLLGHAAYRINSVSDRFLKRLHLLGTEFIPVYSSIELFAKQYTTALEGVVDENTFEEMDGIQAELNSTITAYVEAEKQHERGEMEYPQFDVYAREGTTAQLKSNALDIVRQRAEYLRKLGRQKEIVPWLIDETPYESIYGAAAQSNQHKAALTSIFALSLLLAGCMAYEKQSGMTFLLASAARGRKSVLHCKIGIAAILTTVVWAIPCGLELYTLFSEYAPRTLSAPLQNLSLLEDFPLPCSIGAFMVLLYLLRWLMLFGCALITLGVSERIKRLELAYAAAIAVTVLPSSQWSWSAGYPYWD